MSLGSANPVIIRKYFYKDLLAATAICTVVLTLLLLFGNLNRYNEELIQALALSPLLFLELVSFLSPYAFSMALPFGFCLALLFSVGKWSGDRELLALDSLGFARSSWLKPLFYSTLLASLITGLMTLQFAPLARLQFEEKKSRTLWTNFDRLIESGNEFNFKISSQKASQSLLHLEAFVKNELSRISLSVGLVDGDVWQNLRILLWGEDNVLLCIMHARMASVSKNFEAGSLLLDLEDVDIERTEHQTHSSGNKSSNFIAFKKWSAPVELSFSPNSPNLNNPKMIPFFRLLENIYHSDNKEFIDSSIRVLSKNSVMALSPLFLFPVLISVGFLKGRSETSSNLFWGLIICVTFYSSGLVFSEFLSDFGLGWWVNGLCYCIFGALRMVHSLKV